MVSMEDCMDELAILILRLLVGIALLPHAVMKFKRKKEFDQKWLEKYGLPLGSVLLTAVVQLAGSLLIMSGLFTRYSSAILVINMLVATYVSINKSHEPFISSPEGKGWDINFMIIGVLIVLILIGDGAWSVAGWLIS
jgi:putative oxidoreductase